MDLPDIINIYNLDLILIRLESINQNIYNIYKMKWQIPLNEIKRRKERFGRSQSFYQKKLDIKIEIFSFSSSK